MSTLYCIVTAPCKDWPISSSHTSYPAYMRSPSCLPLAAHHLGSLQDTRGLSRPPHTTYCPAGLLVRTQVHCQTSHSARNPCTVAHHQDTGPNLEVGITWASSTGTPLCGTWLEKRGYHSGVTRGNGKGHIIGNIYKGTCTREKIILPHFLYLCSCILVYSRKPSLWTNIIVTLEYTVSKCVKLFDCLSDLMNLSSTGYLPHLHHPGRGITVSFASEYMASLSVSLPFAKRTKHLKTKHRLLWKLRQK